MKIEGCLVLITGGSSGIGLSTVKHFINLKAFVVFCDLDTTKGKLIENELNNTYGKNSCKFIKCDISNEDEIVKMYDEVKKYDKKLKVLVNNAAVGLGSLFATQKELFKTSDFKKLLEVNVYGTLNMCKYGAQIMMKNNDETCNGSIINISSVSSLDGMLAQSGYSASKAAINGMTLPLARDLGKYKIRVNTILPGAIKTPFIDENDKFVKSIVKASAIGIIGLPEQISISIEMLATNDFINGTLIRVDGGVRFPMF